MTNAVLLLLVVLGLSSLWVDGVAAEPQFCRRAAASRQCAQPPTADEAFKVEEYLGTWYEIGSTASFKLLTEAGLACDQARYSASLSGNLSLLNSGLRVIGHLAVAEVAAVNVAASGACAAAREVCSQFASLNQLTASLPLDPRDALLQELTSSAMAAQQVLQDLADDVSLIQQANGQISQANYFSAGRSLQSSVANIKQYVKEGGRQQEAVSLLASRLNNIRGQLLKQALSDKSEALRKAVVSLGSIALKVGASSTAIDVGLKAVEMSANALLANAQPIEDGGVQSVTGSITQPNTTAAAKLAVDINGVKAPYWIIALEKSGDGGAYSAALVYSCSEVAGSAAESLFVLAREPQLDSATLHSFLAKAESLGVYNDCEDPFLLTLQKGGDCGRATT